MLPVQPAPGVVKHIQEDRFRQLFAAILERIGRLRLTDASG
jgi:hypothetical protein